jgi:hypothetical protein
MSAVAYQVATPFMDLLAWPLLAERPSSQGARDRRRRRHADKTERPTNLNPSLARASRNSKISFKPLKNLAIPDTGTGAQSGFMSPEAPRSGLTLAPAMA